MSLMDRLGRHSLRYLASTAALTIASLVSLPIYTRALGSEKYGYLDLVIVVALLANKLVCVEITQAVGMFQSEESATTASRQATQSAFTFTVLALLLAFSIGTLFSEALSLLIFESKDMVREVQASLFYFLAFGLQYFCLNLFRWNLRPDHYLKISLLQSVGMLTVASVVMSHEITNLAIVITLIGSVYLICVGFSVVMLRDCLALGMNILLAKKMLVFSFPLMLHSSLYWLNSFADRVLVSRLLDAESLGNYAAAAKLGGVVTLLAGVLHSSLTPLIIQRRHDPQLRWEIGNLFRFYIIFFTLGYYFYIGFNQSIVALLFGDEYAGAEGVLPILLIAALVASLYPFFPGAILEKKTKWLLVSSIVGVVVNVTFNIWSIPIWGLSGAAFSTLGGAAAAFFVHLLLSQRLYRVEIKSKPLVVWIIFSAFPFFLAFIWDISLTPVIMFPWIVILVVLAFYSRLLAWGMWTKFFALESTRRR